MNRSLSDRAGRVVLLAVCILLVASPGPVATQALLENRLVVLTPIPLEVANPVADRFAEHARQRYGVAVRPTLVAMGGPTMYARVLEWRGQPDADLLWASEAEVLDDLATRRLIVPHELPDGLVRDVPPTLGEPRPIPLRDGKGFWVGTALTAAGIVYHPHLLRRLGIAPPRDWDDLTECRFKGQVVQTTPDRSATNHSSLEVILQLRGWDRGWVWAQRLAANTGIYVTRSRDVPTFVARGEFAVGFAVLSYMAFQEVLAGHDLRFVSPPYAWISPAPTAVLAGARAPRAARAFLQYLLSEEGQRLMTAHGLFPIVPKYKMEGPPGSVAAQAATFAGMRSFYDRPVKTIYDDDLAQKRYNEVNELYRKLIVERLAQLQKLYCP
ncbi:MAG: extracellular solute-binding protein [Armatimonadota bacterium]|nr:extracellular solute-binding protein [Armatimonadota bacterium]